MLEKAIDRLSNLSVLSVVFAAISILWAAAYIPFGLVLVRQYPQGVLRTSSPEDSRWVSDPPFGQWLAILVVLAGLTLLTGVISYRTKRAKKLLLVLGEILGIFLASSGGFLMVGRVILWIVILAVLSGLTFLTGVISYRTRKGETLPLVLGEILAAFILFSFCSSMMLRVLGRIIVFAFFFPSGYFPIIPFARIYIVTLAVLVGLTVVTSIVSRLASKTDYHKRFSYSAIKIGALSLIVLFFADSWSHVILPGATREEEIMMTRSQVEQLEDTLKSDPMNHEARLKLLSHYTFSTLQFDKAEEHLVTGFKFDPEHPRFRSMLCALSLIDKFGIFHDRELFEDLYDIWKDHAEKDGASAWVFHNLAQLIMNTINPTKDRDLFMEAETYLKGAIELEENPKYNAFFNREIANFYQVVGEPDKAELFCARAQELEEEVRKKRRANTRARDLEWAKEEYRKEAERKKQRENLAPDTEPVETETGP